MSTDAEGADYRRSGAGRRQSWFGLKRPVKAALARPVPHALLRLALRLAPGVDRGRLPAPARLREVRGRADGAEFVMVGPDRCEIAKELYWGGGRRPRRADAFAVDLMARLAREADVFLDVGAYTGLFTLVATAANPSIRATAFEIVPAVAEHLERNAVRNDVRDRVEIRRAGVGAPDRTMRVPSGEGGSALPSFYSSRMTFAEGEEIAFVSLDDAFATLPEGTRVLVKIDVEGTEDEVLGHAGALLARPNVDLLCEVLAGVANEAALHRILSGVGYRTYLLRDADLYAAGSIRASRRYRDWLFTRRTPDALRALGIPVDGAPGPSGGLTAPGR
jgi:FkbM family methyltransferase